jgi:hypothetical protein
VKHKLTTKYKMLNPHLKKAQAKLPNFFSYFKSDDVLIISEDKASLPFACLIFEQSIPDLLLLSICVDYPTSMNVAEIALVASKIYPTAITEPFYISPIDGKTYIDDEAYKKWDIDAIDLEKLPAASEQLN